MDAKVSKQKFNLFNFLQLLEDSYLIYKKNMTDCINLFIL